MFSLPSAVYWLSLCSALLLSGTPLAVLIGGLVGSQLSPFPALATLPLAAMVIGLASMAFFANHLIQKVGFKQVFLLATTMSLCANILAITALALESFSFWLLAMFLIGTTAACAQQMRFVTTHYLSNKATQTPIAISIFMLGGVVAALLGPEVAMLNGLPQDIPYTTGFAVMCVLQFIAALIVIALPKPTFNETSHAKTIQSHSIGKLAIAASVTAYGIMSFIMTATPVSMHEHHGHTLAHTKSVIQWHILAMFLPSLFTGHLIKTFGNKKILWAGMGLYAGVFIFTLQGYDLHNYAIGLILLGIGWNFLFTVGSHLAAQHPNEKFRGTHDTWVFSIQAVVSLGAGLALYSLGWIGIQWLAIIGLLPLTFILLKT